MYIYLYCEYIYLLWVYIFICVYIYLYTYTSIAFIYIALTISLSLLIFSSQKKLQTPPHAPMQKDDKSAPESNPKVAPPCTFLGPGAHTF